MKLTVVLEEQEEGGFMAYVPSLKGCISEGDSKEDAIKNIKEAIELYLESGTDELSNEDVLLKPEGFMIDHIEVAEQGKTSGQSVQYVFEHVQRLAELAGTEKGLHPVPRRRS